MLLNQHLLFFGASVTAQLSPNGYVDLVTPVVEAAGGKVTRRAYGSCHFDDAGFHESARIGADDCTCCFIEWNTTGLTAFNPKKLAYVVGRLLSQGQWPVFLILPQDRNLLQDRAAERQVKEVAERHGLPVIDLRPGFPGMHLLRDTVHTTPEGASFYAQRIVQALRDLPLPTAPTIAGIDAAWRSQQSPPDVRFAPIDESFCVEEGQTWTCPVERDAVLSELMFDVTVGPDSPVVEIELGPNWKRKLQVWDPWAHYERRRFVSFVDESSFSRTGPSGVLKIRVLQEAPDYSTCRLAGFTYDGPRRLRISRVLSSNLRLGPVTVTPSP